jgi:hypothetical protein
MYTVSKELQIHCPHVLSYYSVTLYLEDIDSFTVTIVNLT